MSAYAHSEVLVDTQWAATHLNDPTVRIVEVGVNTQPYDSGHIHGAVCWDVYRDLLQPDNVIIDKPTFEHLLSRSGITNQMIIVLYSDGNMPAALGFWALKLYGHERTHLLNGGRKKWLDERRSITADVIRYAPTTYLADAPNWAIHAPRTYVHDSINTANRVIVDVRNAKEYGGEMFWPNALPKEGERAGHIPNAVHLPYEMALDEDGTFKSIEKLQALYNGQGITAD